MSRKSSHVAYGGSSRIPHACVQPCLSWSSSSSRSIQSPEHHVIFHPSCSAFATLDSGVHSVHPVWCSRWSIRLSFSPSTILSVLFSNTTTRNRRYSFCHVFSLSKSPHHIPCSTIGNTKTFTSFTFDSSATPLSFHIDVSPLRHFP